MEKILPYLDELFAIHSEIVNGKHTLLTMEYASEEFNAVLFDLKQAVISLITGDGLHEMFIEEYKADINRIKTWFDKEG